MATKPKTKAFNAVKTMREIRDRIGRDIMHMTYEEERAYLDKILKAAQHRKLSEK
jgi:hypothetical protein